jgi:hypothetical protein
MEQNIFVNSKQFGHKIIAKTIFSKPFADS